ncbi:hypothetical protein QBC40DRAFT_294245 [Triangularia verruculosa]|uniref:Uncharacterized protein n=1 Tax=Triangularia verruculosa TaxID=2587418 RepID=A0AAN7AVM1_9PEZI|nr:hypothetical protein QBC40DRAFT_294245 [Triangularia verruculosa]
MNNHTPPGAYRGPGIIPDVASPAHQSFNDIMVDVERVALCDVFLGGLHFESHQELGLALDRTSRDMASALYRRGYLPHQVCVEAFRLLAFENLFRERDVPFDWANQTAEYLKNPSGRTASIQYGFMYRSLQTAQHKPESSRNVGHDSQTVFEASRLDSALPSDIYSASPSRVSSGRVGRAPDLEPETPTKVPSVPRLSPVRKNWDEYSSASPLPLPKGYQDKASRDREEPKTPSRAKNSKKNWDEYSTDSPLPLPEDYQVTASRDREEPELHSRATKNWADYSSGSPFSPPPAESYRNRARRGRNVSPVRRSSWGDYSSFGSLPPLPREFRRRRFVSPVPSITHSYGSISRAGSEWAFSPEQATMVDQLSRSYRHPGRYPTLGAQRAMFLFFDRTIGIHHQDPRLGPWEVLIPPRLFCDWFYGKDGQKLRSVVNFDTGPFLYHPDVKIWIRFYRDSETGSVTFVKLCLGPSSVNSAWQSNDPRRTYILLTREVNALRDCFLALKINILEGGKYNLVDVFGRDNQVRFFYRPGSLLDRMDLAFPSRNRPAIERAG